MTKKTFLVFILFVTGFVMCACAPINQLLNPTPVPPPVGSNDDWEIKILRITKFDEPKELNCTDCEPGEPSKGLSLQEKKSYIDVAVQIINQSSEEIAVEDVTIGLMLNTFTYGCGGLTVAGTDYCLTSGIIRGGNNYINYGVDTESFEKHLTFKPNSPDGEIVDFIFIVNQRAKHTDFYFDSIPPINIKKVKAVIIESEK